MTEGIVALITLEGYVLKGLQCARVQTPKQNCPIMTTTFNSLLVCPCLFLQAYVDLVYPCDMKQEFHLQKQVGLIQGFKLFV